MKIIGILILVFSFTRLFAQCPSFSFDYEANICVNESLDISNITDGLEYEWDFCSGDIELGFTGQVELNDNNFFRNRTIKVINDEGVWYAFAISQTSNNLQRIDLGVNLENPSNTLTDLGTFSGALNGAYDLDMIFDGQLWRGFVANTNNGSITRFDFNDGINMSPDLVELGNFGGNITSPTHILLKEIDNNYYAFVSNEEDLIRLSFGTVLTETNPSVGVFNVAGSNTLRGFSLVRECDEWLGLILSYSNNRIYSVDFASDITGTPTFNQLTTTNALSFPANVSIINENANYYAFVQGALGRHHRLDFSSSLVDFLFTDQTIADATFTSDQNFALEIVSDGSNWYGYNFNLDNREFISFPFSDNCTASSATYSEKIPVDINYSQAGTYNVSTKFTDNNGDIVYQSNVVNVSADIAPSTSFTIDPNRCISVTNSFTTSSPGITHSWDFDGDGLEDSSMENPTYDYDIGSGGPGPGTYTVRLDVNDGTCDNFTEQEITIYPDPPTPTFTALTLECANTPILFTNTTDESLHTGAITYSWDFNGEGSSTDKDPTFSFATAGTKSVTLESIIPGCTNTSMIFNIEVSPGPTSTFTPSRLSICENETISFTDQSTGSPTSFSWDFDDGFTSTAQNPDHLFTTVGNYDVALTVTDALGCENTTMQEVVVSPLPIVDFSFDTPCTSTSGIQFTDLTTVLGSDLASWEWFVDNVSTSTAESPVLTFSQEGTVNVRLEATSLNGCTSSYNEDIEIRTTPQPDFSVNLGCDGEPSTFSDLTSSPGNAVGTWLWTLDGTTYGTQNINHTFSSAGIFDVTLEVTGQNFCAESITYQVEILELPTVNFDIQGDCSNETIQVTDVSTIDQDPIISREWRLDGNPVGNGSELLLSSLAGSSYDLELEVTTQSGCVTNRMESIVINTSPQALMEASKTFGLPGDNITFTNNSTGASSYEWLLDDQLVSIDPIRQILTFSEPGTYTVSLIASNDLGCSDVSTSEVLIAIPEVDLSIGQFEIIDNNGTGSIFVEIQNNSNLPVEVIEAVVELENQFSVTEQILAPIGIGESQLVNLNVGIPLNFSELTYLCVTLNSQYIDFADITPVNNEKCLAIKPKFVVEAPFPNPARDEVRVKLISPSETTTQLSIFNSSGKMEFATSQNLQEGLNNFFIDLRSLKSGVYFIRLESQGTTTIQRIVKL